MLPVSFFCAPFMGISPLLHPAFDLLLIYCQANLVDLTSFCPLPHTLRIGMATRSGLELGPATPVVLEGHLG